MLVRVKIREKLLYRPQQRFQRAIPLYSPPYAFETARHSRLFKSRRVRVYHSKTCQIRGSRFRLCARTRIRKPTKTLRGITGIPADSTYQAHINSGLNSSFGFRAALNFTELARSASFRCSRHFFANSTVVVLYFLVFIVRDRSKILCSHYSGCTNILS